VTGSRHGGIDLAMREGTDIYSTAFGVVKFAGSDEIFGQMVIVANNDSIETLYGHNSKLLVREGDTIFAGQRVALSGNTGLSSAPHLHYEIRIKGKAVNPINYFMESHETN
jgi:murein DD-endopeptidase MepM/ murein hydrolase activator NlpD